jgi:hypothetical protein
MYTLLSGRDDKGKRFDLYAAEMNKHVKDTIDV